LPRNISFAQTTEQFLANLKDVTRRVGWLDVKEGDMLVAVRKGQGLKKGEKVTRLGRIRVTSVRRECLELIAVDEEYGREEVRREGFPDKTPAEFVAFFCAGHRGCTPGTIVTRIEFVREEARTAEGRTGKAGSLP
jgi:hypothetical protein